MEGARSTEREKVFIWVQSTGASWVRIPQLVTHRNRIGSTPTSAKRESDDSQIFPNFDLHDRLQLHKHVA
jgi:hypothetical protein